MDIEDKLQLFALLERIATSLERLNAQDTRIDTLTETVNALCKRAGGMESRMTATDLLKRPLNPKLEIKR